MEQEGRRDVVREVADHAQTGAERREIELERVAFVDRETLGRKFLLEPGDDIAIDFDDVKVFQPRHQRVRERAQAGADFYH